MLKGFLFAGLAVVISACATLKPDAQGRFVLDERSEVLGNLHRNQYCGKDCMNLVLTEPCTVNDITGCGYSDERPAILAAWKDGKLFVRNPDTNAVVQVSSSAKGGN